MRVPWFYKTNSHAINRRLAGLFAGAFSLISLVIIIILFTIIFYVSLDEMRKDTSTLANLMGINCAAPILFDDPFAAKEIIATLHIIPRIRAVQIFTPDKMIFASYPDPTEGQENLFLEKSLAYGEKEDFDFFNNRYYLTLPIRFQQKNIGYISIASDLERVYSRIRWFAWTTVLILALSGLVVGFLYSWLTSAIDALQESEKRYRRVFENTGTAMIICDTDGMISMANAMFEKMIGKGKQEIEGVTTWNDLIFFGNKPATPPLDKSTFDISWPGPEGDKKYLFVKTDMLPGTEQKIVSLTDITPIKKAEEELLKNEKMKTEFIYVASHELRTPLQSMLLGISDLLEAEEIRDNPELYEEVEMVSAGISRLTRLVENLLDLSRIETGRIKPILKKVNVTDIIENVMREVGPLSQRYGHDIRQVGTLLPLSIWADKGKIEQVLINLIGNAIKFTPEGGTILIDYRQKEEEILFAVADNGYGIPEYFQKDIFTKFFQADFYMSDRVGGVGLGLTICKHIIDEHGGEIHCKSPVPQGMYDMLSLDEKRKGTIFSFSLKAADD